MLRGDRKYYAIILFVLGVVFTLQLMQKEPTNYQHTFSHNDKNPYGGYVLKQLLPAFIGNEDIENVNRTLYEIQDELSADVNLLIIADRINFDPQDSEVLLNAVHEGMSAYILVSEVMGVLADTLGLDRERFDFNEIVNDNRDTFSITSNNLKRVFEFKRDAATTYYDAIDSVAYNVLAQNNTDKIFAFKANYGKGQLVLCTMPLAFTNNYLLHKEHADFAASILTDIPNKPTIWSEYYQLGRLEVNTPMRVILMSPPLKLAYGIVIAGLLLFMFFEAKRRQRIIPVLIPFKNTTLEFIGTIGNLYLKSGEHKDIALKRIQYFHEFLREKYYLNFEQFKPDYFDRLAAKTGKDVAEIKRAFDFMERIKQMPKVGAAELKKLNTIIESFYGRSK